MANRALNWLECSEIFVSKWFTYRHYSSPTYFILVRSESHWPIWFLPINLKLKFSIELNEFAYISGPSLYRLRLTMPCVLIYYLTSRGCFNVHSLFVAVVVNVRRFNVRARIHRSLHILTIKFRSSRSLTTSADIYLCLFTVHIQRLNKQAQYKKKMRFWPYECSRKKSLAEREDAASVTFSTFSYVTTDTINLP